MPLEILPQTTLRTMDPQASSKLARLSPGDMIEARVLGFSASGKTLLQAGGAKIIAEKDLGAKPGDILRLEVQKGPQATSPTGRTRVWFTIRRLDTAPPPQASSVGKASAEPFPALKGRGPHLVSTDLFHSRALVSRIDGPSSALTEFAAARLLTPAALINSKRIQSLRKRVLRRAANTAVTRKTQAIRGGPPQQAHTTTTAPRQLAIEGQEPTTPSEYTADFGFAPPREGIAAVKLKIKPDKGWRGRTDKEGTLRASMLLDLENTGVIEVNLTMGADQIWVDFITATPQMRQKIEAERGDVYAALSALVKKVTFQVRSDHRLMARDLFAEGREYPAGDIDFNI
jgi:hypothetical protein